MNLLLLGNDNIADINIPSQDSFIKSLDPLINLAEKEFSSIPKTQKVALKVTIHKSGPATLNLEAQPELDPKIKIAFLKEAAAIKIENTTIVDFPIALLFNAGLEDASNIFSIYMLEEQRKKDLKDAGLKEQLQIIQRWAAQEALPVLGAYCTAVDDKFAGVKEFGKQITTKDFLLRQDVEALTSNNKDYWRAVMEMSPGNQLLPTIKVLLLTAQGRLDYAEKYAELLQLFSNKESKATGYLKETLSMIKQFQNTLNNEINKGVAFHDKGQYEQALEAYTKILEAYPESAWAKYEVYFTKNISDIQNGIITTKDRSQWDAAKIDIYKSNPLYNMDVRAGTGKEAFLMYRRFELSDVFKDPENRINEVYQYADIAMDLGIYDYAAQFFWLTFTYKSDNSQKSLDRYLYCLEKLGIPEWKENFKGNWVKTFKNIDTEKEKTMKQSAAYNKIKS